MIDTRSPISITSALWRGFTMRCPNCARGRLFPRYLKVADRCPNCSEDFSHHRADDFPAYLVIIVIGHIVIPAMLVVEEIFAPAIWSCWGRTCRIRGIRGNRRRTCRMSRR